MPRPTPAILALTAALGAAASVASADVINATITADNHYALYTSTGGAFSYQGGNELGAGGNPGQYNWSMAETYQFQAGDSIYIAAWSDDSVAQGVLAQFDFVSRDSIMSGDSRWVVYGTGINRGDGDPHPTIPEIAGYVNFADANSLWEPTFVGDPNGVEPWGSIAGISSQARWMWQNVPGDADPLHGGSGAGEMLIFRSVPAPGAAAIMLLGAGAVTRRRR